MSKYYVGDVGTEIVLNTGTDISTAAVMKILVRKPSGEEIIWDATAEGENGMRYVIAEGDLDESGSWKLQAYVEIPPITKVKGETATLKVYDPYR